MAPIRNAQVLVYKMIRNSRRRQSAFQSLILLLQNRRQQLIRLTFVLALLVFSRHNSTALLHSPRSCRRFSRNPGWFDSVWQTYSDARFKKTFRISRETFRYLLSKIEPRLQRQTVTEEPLSPAFRLAICLYRLARGDYLYTISELVGCGRSTVGMVVDEVVEAIVDELWEEHVSKHFPKTEEQFREKILDTEELWQFPCCWAAIDGCHIPLKCPNGGLAASKEYHNFKNFYSIVLMGIVDAKYRFVWASCGFPGNSHDSIIFQSTQLWKDITEENSIQPRIAKDIAGIEVSPLILGDSAFPFRSWLMKPFTNAVLTPEQRYYNYRLSRARMVTEGAYGQLKGRWRVLLRKCESPPEKVRLNALACIVLHNICIDRKETMSRQLDLTVDPVTNMRRDRDVIRQLLKMRNSGKVNDNSIQATRVRNALTRVLWDEKESLTAI